MTIKRIIGLAAGAVAVLALAACGGSSKGGAAPSTSTEAKPGANPPATTATTTGGSTQVASAAGKSIFTENCSSCHTLLAADAHGTVGPNLDSLQPSEAAVEHQVTNGGAGPGGNMPAFKGQLTPKQIKTVAAYVAAVAGKQP